MNYALWSPTMEQGFGPSFKSISCQCSEDGLFHEPGWRARLWNASERTYRPIYRPLPGGFGPETLQLPPPQTTKYERSYRNLAPDPGFLLGTAICKVNQPCRMDNRPAPDNRSTS